MKTSEAWEPIPNEPPYDYETDLDCPDCDKLWPKGFTSCPHCGLTIEEVAERLV